MNQHFNPNEARDHHGRWTKGAAVEKLVGIAKGLKLGEHVEVGQDTGVKVQAIAQGYPGRQQRRYHVKGGMPGTSGQSATGIHDTAEQAAGAALKRSAQQTNHPNALDGHTEHPDLAAVQRHTDHPLTGYANSERLNAKQLAADAAHRDNANLQAETVAKADRLPEQELQKLSPEELTNLHRAASDQGNTALRDRAKAIRAQKVSGVPSSAQRERDLPSQAQEGKVTGGTFEKPKLKKIDPERANGQYGRETQITQVREVHVNGQKVGELRKHENYYDQSMMSGSRISGALRRDPNIPREWKFHPVGHGGEVGSRASHTKTAYTQGEALQHAQAYMREKGIGAAPERKASTPASPGAASAGPEFEVQTTPQRGGEVSTHTVRAGSHEAAHRTIENYADTKVTSVRRVVPGTNRTHPEDKPYDPSEHRASKNLLFKTNSKRLEALSGVPRESSKNVGATEGATKSKTHKVEFNGQTHTRRSEQNYTHASKDSQGNVRFHQNESSAKRAAGRFGQVKALSGASAAAPKREPNNPFKGNDTASLRRAVEQFDKTGSTSELSNLAREELARREGTTKPDSSKIGATGGATKSKTQPKTGTAQPLNPNGGSVTFDSSQHSREHLNKTLKAMKPGDWINFKGSNVKIYKPNEKGWEVHAPNGSMHHTNVQGAIYHSIDAHKGRQRPLPKTAGKGRKIRPREPKESSQ